jgi:hypothetical protein
MDWLSQIGSLRSLELAQLPLGFVARNAVTLLHGAKQLIALSFDAVQVIICELTPLLLNLAAKLFPLAFNGIPVHGIALIKQC